jgi:hypothetical protein
LEVLGLTLDYDQPELPLQVSDVAEYNRRRQAEIDERRTMRIPAEEPDEMDLGEARQGLPDQLRLPLDGQRPRVARPGIAHMTLLSPENPTCPEVRTAAITDGEQRHMAAW